MASMHQHTTTMWTHGGHIIERAGNAQAGPWHPAGVYPCRDGYVFLGHATGAKLVPFVEVLGYGHLFDDPRFATDPARAQHKREFDAALTERLLELTAEEISELGRAVFSPIGPARPSSTSSAAPGTSAAATAPPAPTSATATHRPRIGHDFRTALASS